MLPPTMERVPRSTSGAYNQAISQQTVQNIAHYARGGRRAIDARLEDLKHEWDIERVLEANAASAVLTGLALGLFVNRRFLVLPGLVAGFLLQHALQGWCPPVPLFRRLGIRTAKEIDEERYALKALRGDFRDITGGNTSGTGVEMTLEAVRR